MPELGEVWIPWEHITLPPPEGPDPPKDPLAAAIRAQYDMRGYIVEVFRDGVRIRTMRYDWIYRHPKYVTEWLDAWDRGERVVPIGIDYGKPHCVDREGGHTGLPS